MMYLPLYGRHSATENAGFDWTTEPTHSNKGKYCYPVVPCVDGDKMPRHLCRLGFRARFHWVNTQPLYNHTTFLLYSDWKRHTLYRRFLFGWLFLKIRCLSFLKISIFTEGENSFFFFLKVRSTRPNLFPTLKHLFSLN